MGDRPIPLDQKRQSLLTGLVFFVVGASMTLVAASDLFFSSHSNWHDWLLSPGPFIFTLFGALPMCLGANLVVRYFIDKPIAEHMHGKHGLTSAPVSGSSELHADNEAHDAPDIVFNQIDSLLPACAHTQRLTETRNCLGEKPPKILMLWNFQRLPFSQHKTMLSVEAWQRVGPVYMLTNESGMSIRKFLFFNWSNSLQRAFVSSNNVFLSLLARVDDRPISHNLFSWVGGRRHAYPLHRWICTANSWQDSVYAMCDHVDIVIMDARGFSSERAGLIWEIACLVDRVHTSKFAVLTDETTSIQELQLAFSKAWKNMSANSPNRSNVEGVKILQGLGVMHYETGRRYPEPFYRYEASQVAQLF